MLLVIISAAIKSLTGSQEAGYMVVTSNTANRYGESLVLHPAETQAKGQHDILDYAEVCRRLQCKLTDLVRPDHSQCVVLWGDEGTYDHVDLEVGQPVRLKTKGDSPFIGDYRL